MRFALLFAGAAASSVTQVHIAIAGADGMAVSWRTEDESVDARVRYGASAESLDAAATGAVVSYLAGSGFHHHAVLSPLTRGARYYYKIDGDDATRSFVAPPAPERRDLKFAVWGDLASNNPRGAEGGSTIAYLQARDDVELWWHAGDVSYADDAFLHPECFARFCYEARWDAFLEEMEAAGADSIPYMVAPGNHEADCHDPACVARYEQYARPLANFSAYNARFRMPSAESGARALNMHYSFEVGPVHFVSLDTETGYPGAPERTRYVFPCGGFGDMLAWLEADLARVDRAATPWVFVAGHHPMYQGGLRNARMADALEGLLREYRVDAMFTGARRCCQTRGARRSRSSSPARASASPAPWNHSEARWRTERRRAHP